MLKINALKNSQRLHYMYLVLHKHEYVITCACTLLTGLSPVAVLLILHLDILNKHHLLYEGYSGREEKKKERERKREGERETMPLNAAIIYPRDIASGGFLSVMKLLATLFRVGSIVYKKNRHTQMLN